MPCSVVVCSPDDTAQMGLFARTNSLPLVLKPLGWPKALWCCWPKAHWCCWPGAHWWCWPEAHSCCWPNKAGWSIGVSCWLEKLLTKPLIELGMGKKLSFRQIARGFYGSFHISFVLSCLLKWPGETECEWLSRSFYYWEDLLSFGACSCKMKVNSAIAPGLCEGW